MGGGPVGLGRGGDLDHDSDQKAWRHLEQHIAWLWPYLSGVTITHRWGGPFSVTMDLTPALGYLGGDRTAVYGLGCIGHGVAMSYLNGEVLADLLTGDGDGETSRQCPVRQPAGDPLAARARGHRGQVRHPLLPASRGRLPRAPPRPGQADPWTGLPYRPRQPRLGRELTRASERTLLRIVSATPLMARILRHVNQRCRPRQKGGQITLLGAPWTAPRQA
jgi:hypothetical protein